MEVITVFLILFVYFSGGEKLMVDVKHGQPQELDRLPVCATANTHYHDMIPDVREHAPMDNRFTPLYFFTQINENPPETPQAHIEMPFLSPPSQKISGEHLLGLYIYTFEDMYTIPPYTANMKLQQLPFCPKKHLKRLKNLAKHTSLFSKQVAVNRN